MTGLTVSLHDARHPTPPAGWDAFVDTRPLPAMWNWSLVNAVATASRPSIIAATIHDGGTIRGMATARLIGPRTRRGAVPLAGLADVDCLTCASMPGIVCDSAAGTPPHADAVLALREELRRAFGRHIRGVMFRQVSAEMLPSVLRWPAIVREGGPVAVFRNTFSDFDGYLASLRKSRRWSLRRSVRDVEADPELVISFTSARDRPPLRAEDIRTLNDLVVRRHHHRWWLRKRLMAPEVARAQLALPGVRWLTYRDRADGLVAYGTMWDHPDEPYVGAWGAGDVAQGGRKDLWFHFNATLVRWCIDQRRSGYVSGQGSIAEKLRLGHGVRRQWAVLIPHRSSRS